MLYLAFTLGGAFILWGFSHLSKKVRKIELEKEHLITCEYCRFVFLKDKTSKITKCPQCGSYAKGK